MDNAENKKPLLLKGLLIGCAVLSLIALSAALFQINDEFKKAQQKTLRTEKEMQKGHGKGQCVSQADYTQKIAENETLKSFQKTLKKKNQDQRAAFERYKEDHSECVPKENYEDEKTAFEQFRKDHSECVSQKTYDKEKARFKQFEEKHRKCISQTEHKKKVDSFDKTKKNWLKDKKELDTLKGKHGEGKCVPLKKYQEATSAAFTGDDSNAKRVQDLEKEVQKLKKERDEARKKLEQTQKANATLKKDNESLQNKVNSLRSKPKNGNGQKTRIPKEPTVPQFSKKKLSECYKSVYVTIDGVEKQLFDKSFLAALVDIITFNNQQVSNDIYVKYCGEKIEAFCYQDGALLKFYISKEHIDKNNTLTEGSPVCLGENNIFLYLPEGFKVTPVKEENEWIQIDVFKEKNISFTLK